MTDIKLAFSPDTCFCLPTDDNETPWIGEAGPFYYELHRETKTARTGCWVYFVSGEQLVGRARAEEFFQMTGREGLCSLMGIEQRHTSWCVRCSQREVLGWHFRIATASRFEGFRSVRGEERRRFAEAFEKQARRELPPGTRKRSVQVREDAITLRGGHTVLMTHLQLEPTYEGVLEGTLRAASLHKRERLRDDIRRMFPLVQNAVVIDENLLALPRYQWTAVFQGFCAVRTDDPDFLSRSVVCWFTDTVPADMRTMLKNILAQVDWDKQAEDFSILP